MRIYLIIAVCAMIGGAYLTGGKVAREKCRAEYATAGTNEVIKSINITRAANEKSFNTGVHDIRDRLRRYYTIAE